MGSVSHSNERQLKNNQKAMTKRVSEVECCSGGKKEGSGHFKNGRWTTGEMKGALASQHGEGGNAACLLGALDSFEISGPRAHGGPSPLQVCNGAH